MEQNKLLEKKVKQEVLKCKKSNGYDIEKILSQLGYEFIGYNMLGYGSKFTSKHYENSNGKYGFLSLIRKENKIMLTFFEFDENDNLESTIVFNELPSIIEFIYENGENIGVVELGCANPKTYDYNNNHIYYFDSERRMQRQNEDEDYVRANRVMAVDSSRPIIRIKRTKKFANDIRKV